MALNDFAHSAAKLAKSLLSSDQTNLVLWDAYARLERNRGRLAEARNVYQQTLQSAQQFGSTALAVLPQLWLAFVEMELEEQRPTVAAHLVVAASLPASEQTAQLKLLRDSVPSTHPAKLAILRAKAVRTRAPNVPSLLTMSSSTTTLSCRRPI